MRAALFDDWGNARMRRRGVQLHAASTPAQRRYVCSSEAESEATSGFSFDASSSFWTRPGGLQASWGRFFDRLPDEQEACSTPQLGFLRHGAMPYVDHSQYVHTIGVCERAFPSLCLGLAGKVCAQEAYATQGPLQRRLESLGGDRRPSGGAWVPTCLCFLMRWRRMPMARVRSDVSGLATSSGRRCTMRGVHVKEKKWRLLIFLPLALKHFEVGRRATWSPKSAGRRSLTGSRRA